VNLSGPTVPPNALVAPSAVAALLPSILLLYAALRRSVQTDQT